MQYSSEKTIPAQVSVADERTTVPTAAHEPGPKTECSLTTSGHRRTGRLLKRVIDIFGSFIMILLLSPLILLVWVLVRIVDGSPAIYRRRVIGVHGEFDAYKFRTMRRDADALLAADSTLRSAFEGNFKLKSDPRVTRLGSWLRKYSCDELPQLFNVLKGQMSLVGPRMITTAELGKYGPHQELLLTVKPGITGYWQVRGRQNVSYDERVRMDVAYITNWSLSLDFLILLQTPAKVIQTEGAY
jgi:lipopolysaccharide/colanic/teichoic acid biosynthesis glycosyltransferase